MNAGFETVNQIIDIKPENLLDVDGFNIKSAEKLVANIKNQLLDKEHDLEVVMTASNIFTGFGKRKLKLIVDYLRSNGKDFSQLEKLSKEELISIEGYSNKTAEQVISSIPKFIEWIEEHQHIRIKSLEPVKQVETQAVIISALTGKNIVMTGFRDKMIHNQIVKMGGKVQNGVNGKTNILIVKDETAMKGNKYNKAIELGVEVYTLSDFMKKYEI